MANKLQQYFPMIKTRQEVMVAITQDPKLNAIFTGWEHDQQEDFLSCCTGAKGCKVVYDSFFKEVFNPEAAPERLERFLSLLMKQEVRILQVLPNDSTRLADENSLLIMDIVVELTDHSLANIEIQRMGYMFPGQRSSCYSSDLLLRQYKRVKSEKKSDSAIKTSGRSTALFCLSAVRRNSRKFQMYMFIQDTTVSIPGFRSNYFRNISLYLLTFF